MPLIIYNTLTQKKEAFISITPGEVRFYVCGVTVYDYCHIGHARAYVVFDTIRRYLKFLGYKVQYVQNFTDIDDKIINRSNELSIPFQQLTETYIQAYFEDMDQLGIVRADHYPKATDYITHMQSLIAKLIEKGAAYVAGGDVWFSVSAFSEYGKLSKKVLEDLQSGARVEVSTVKRSPLDFVLWKAAKAGEPFWESPWGKGRPGWHTECSAMAMHLLGETIDIHGGGEDLIFPHHENEISQSEIATGKPFSRFWIHNGFVNIHNEKMSKSTQNFLTIRDILKEYPGDILRFFLLKVHYRSPLSFSYEGLDEAKKALDRLKTTLANIPQNAHLITPEIQVQLATFQTHFTDAMSDDFNFSEAIGVLFELNRFINIHQCGVDSLRYLGQILGLFEQPESSENSIPEAVQQLAVLRTQAKQQKDYPTADKIRDQLTVLGYKIEDTADGVRLKKLS